jgi:hypothetical protein
VLKGEVKRSFDEFERAINALDAHIGGKDTNFLPVSGSPDKVLLGVPGSPLLGEILDESTGRLKEDQIEVWRMKNTVPPRKRAVHAAAEAREEEMLIPGLKRISKQLHVDFAISVHSSGEGKRKRGPTRSIYEEAVAAVESTKGGKKKRRKIMMMDGKQQKHQKQQRKASSSKAMGGERKEEKGDSAEISEIDETEFFTQSRKPQQKQPQQKRMSKKMIIMMESVSAAHAAALEAKNEIIRSMMESHASAIQSKDEIIRTQAALIATLKESPTATALRYDNNNN